MREKGGAHSGRWAAIAWVSLTFEALREGSGGVAGGSWDNCVWLRFGMMEGVCRGRGLNVEDAVGWGRVYW